jgi:peptide/nickel transport system permease protein
MSERDKNAAVKRNSPAREIWRRFKKNKAAMLGLGIFSVMVLLAVFADVICDYDTQVIAQDVANRLKAPSPDHWFGTDAYGRDIFARVVHGARISIIIGLAATVGSVCISGILGSIAGYYGGRIDNAIMRVLDTFLAIPGELLAMAIVASLGLSMTNLLIAVTIARIPPFTRVIRSSILTVIDQDYIESAIASGARDSYIIVKHILPNAMGPIIIQATMGVGRMILTAAGMSFIGMGVQPPLPEWGSMLAEGRDFMRYSPYITLFPGLAIILTSLALNLLGDGLRDALDPKLKN